MNTTYVDQGKRGRLLFLAIIISLSLFALRSSGIVEIQNYLHILGLFLGYSLFTYVALIWALRGQVSRRSLIVIIPQSTIFVTTQVLFVYTFFFRDFERIYEFILLSLLMLFITASIYISFLMTNIFNVSLYKEIPLLQVAKTTSYIITLLVVYYATFVITSLDLPVYLTIPGLLVFYIYAVSMHLFEIDREIFSIKAIIAPIVTSMLVVVIPVIYIGARSELTALMPVSVAFAMLGFEMIKNKSVNKNLLYLQYFMIIALAAAINIAFQ